MPHEVLEARRAPLEQLLGQLNLGLEGLDLGAVAAHCGTTSGLVDVPGAVGLDVSEEDVTPIHHDGGPVVVAVQSTLVLRVVYALALPDAMVGTVVDWQLT